VLNKTAWLGRPRQTRRNWIHTSYLWHTPLSSIYH
jgi:hypothetical protein